MSVAACSACIGVMPRSHHGDELVGLGPVRDGRRIGAAGDLDAGGERLGEHLAGLREDLRRLLLQDRVDAVDGHVVGQRGGADQEGPGLRHQRNGVVAGERPVLDAVDPGPDAGPDAGVAVGVGGDAQAVAVGLVHDRLELLVGVLLCARPPS